jgi:DsbC/DsbD-like thiol-disulfide interchange protein/cytochrome c biogenesis protein CcdA
MLRRLLIFLALLLAGPAAAQPLAAVRNHIAAELVAESERPAAGQNVTLAFSFTPEPGWHGYWLNPGDAGAPMRVAWSLPSGVDAGTLRFPVPAALLVSGLMNHVYEGPHALLLDLRLPAALAPGTRLPIRAKIDYLACTDQICVPESAELSLSLTVGDGIVTPAARARFDAWRAALPQPLASEGRFALAGNRLRIAMPLPAPLPVERAYLFAASDNALTYAAPQSITRNGDSLIVEAGAASGAGALTRFEGVLKLADGRGLSFSATPGPVPPAGAAVPVIAPEDGSGRAAAGVKGTEDGSTVSGFLAALLGAILGGLILNIMPCVFPILSLKALSLARAGGDGRSARGEAVAYSAGVIVTCLALGVVLLALKAAGSTAGWAYQLQEPRFVLFLLLLVTAIALNLAGLFSLPSLSIARSGGGTLGAFATGALAAFIATPCTGPFMATAFAATLLMPPAASLAIYAALGFGLALPFLLIAFVPPLRRLIPRPGGWMVALQRILAVPMLLTALALAWVLGRETGVGGMTLGLGGALMLGVALWWLGARGSTGQRWAAFALAAVAVAGSIATLNPAPPAATAEVSTSGLGAEPFSEARLAQLRAERAPVFVYFTADWCLTCKVNEHGALASDEVIGAFRRRGVRVLEGDWTLGDPALGHFIEAQGRSGVPLYLYYPPGGEAQVLPQILSAAALTELVG